MDISAQDLQVLTSVLNNLILPITITPQIDQTGNTTTSYNWQWYKYSGNATLFKDALHDALVQAMSLVSQYAPSKG